MEICAQQGVEGLPDDLIRVYHTLGHLIHYHYDPLLKDIVILKPDWLAKAISFALDDRHIRANLSPKSTLNTLKIPKTKKKESISSNSLASGSPEPPRT
ncbi:MULTISPECIES: COR domain-containing protein [unclassified Roseofilum]|uniref:COR domain-containing protein n=1 Tax=unclassified Roseofilum TaxID=2620099 RepID=UPI00298E2122|nr:MULTISPECIES: COR domain-containing protein [unclassified Roseofilum]